MNRGFNEPKKVQSEGGPTGASHGCRGCPVTTVYMSAGVSMQTPENGREQRDDDGGTSNYYYNKTWQKQGLGRKYTQNSKRRKVPIALFTNELTFNIVRAPCHTSVDNFQPKSTHIEKTRISHRRRQTSRTVSARPRPR